MHVPASDASDHARSAATATEATDRSEGIWWRNTDSYRRQGWRWSSASAQARASGGRHRGHSRGTPADLDKPSAEAACETNPRRPPPRRLRMAAARHAGRAARPNAWLGRHTAPRRRGGTLAEYRITFAQSRVRPTRSPWAVRVRCRPTPLPKCGTSAVQSAWRATLPR